MQLTGRVFAWELHEKRAMLLDAVKQGGEGLTILPPLFLREETNQTTAEYREIYESQSGKEAV